MFFPVAFIATSWSDFLQIDFVLGCAVFGIAGPIGCILNCVADRDVDMAFKSTNAMAVQALGLRSIVYRLVGLYLVGAVFSILLIIRTHSALLLITLGAIAIFFGGEYSFPPLHLKSRGILEILTVGLTVIVIPGMVMIVAVRHHLDAMGVVAVVGFAMVMCSLNLVETAEDIPEDREFGIKTTAVWLGLAPTMYLAMMFDLLGLLDLAYITIARHGLGLGAFVVLVSALLPLPYLVKIVCSLRGRDEEGQIQAVRAHSRYLPIMYGFTGLGMVIGALISSGLLVNPL